MVGGVYAPGKQNTYVSLRAVNRFTKHVIASTDFSVVLGPDVKTLLKTKDAGSSVIPSGSPGDLPEPILENAAPAAENTSPTPTPVPAPAVASEPSGL
jgi:hypothetical protein